MRTDLNTSNFSLIQKSFPAFSERGLSAGKRDYVFIGMLQLTTWQKYSSLNINTVRTWKWILDMSWLGIKEAEYILFIFFLLFFGWFFPSLQSHSCLRLVWILIRFRHIHVMYLCSMSSHRVSMLQFLGLSLHPFFFFLFFFLVQNGLFFWFS